VQWEGDRFGRPQQAAPARVAVHLAGDNRPLGQTPALELSLNQEPWAQSALTLDKRLVFVRRPRHRDAAGTNNRLVLHRFDVEEVLDKSGVDYLLVTSRPPARVKPGDTLVYRMTIKSKKGGVQCRLESGPEGMRVSPDGKLTWKAPAKATSDTVIIMVRDKTGQEMFHTFKLTAEDTAGAPQAANADAGKPKAPTSRRNRRRTP